MRKEERGTRNALTLKGIWVALSFRTPSDKDTAAPSGRADLSGRAKPAHKERSMNYEL